MKVVAPRLVTHSSQTPVIPGDGGIRQEALIFIQGEKNTDPKRLKMLANVFRLVIQSGCTNVAEPESARVLATLQSIDPHWHRVLEAGGLVLMLPDGAVPEGPA
jgi:hypothetical protein